MPVSSLIIFYINYAQCPEKRQIRLFAGFNMAGPVVVPADNASTSSSTKNETNKRSHLNCNNTPTNLTAFYGPLTNQNVNLGLSQRDRTDLFCNINLIPAMPFFDKTSLYLS